ncbi:FtsX-like permease family protein [Lachnospiraceae bacterium MD308]|nr:FtsX-like permease family protein [Lachnospiraceae bacterium MD308]
MNVITTTAFANLRKNKSRNILIGTAIVLTAFLLTLLPTMVTGQLSLQFQAVNELYAPIHGVYRNVDGETAAEMAEDDVFETVCRREIAGKIYTGDKDITADMFALDETVIELSRIELKEGTFPKKADEIVVSEGCLKAMGLEGGVGDRIKVPYQPVRKGKLLKTAEKEFTIVGMTEDSPESLEKGIFTPMVSEAFAKEIIPEGEHVYDVYFQLHDIEGMVTKKIEERIEIIGEQYGLSKNDIRANSEYLFANYVDGALYAGLGALLAVIVLAGILTIYSIYYVSMLDKVQEYGRLRAIGATKGQIRKLVLREGFAVAAIAVPAGIILGLAGAILMVKAMVSSSMDGNRVLGEQMKAIFKSGDASLVKGWVILLAAGVSLLTVFISLLSPMRKASKITAMEALRYQGGRKGKKERTSRKGYDALSIPRLTVSNLGRNKRRTAVTILSLGATGVLFVAAATACNCMNAEDATRDSIRSDILVSIDPEEGDEMHPEWALSSIQQNNPMTEELKGRIEKIDGVTAVKASPKTDGKIEKADGAGKEEPDGEGNVTEKEEPGSGVKERTGKMTPDEINGEVKGLDAADMKELSRYVTEGSLGDASLKDGTGIVFLEPTLKREFPDWKVGDKLYLEIVDGEKIKGREVTLAAIAQASPSLMGYYIAMPEDSLKAMCSSDVTYYWDISVEKGKEETAAEEVRELVSEAEVLEVRTFLEENKLSENAIRYTLYGCYGMLAVFGLIGILNLINTMINSVHVRKKELGMLQAIGMSGRQTVYMLQLEGLFYTAGTLVLSLGFGSILGYVIFLWAKTEGLMGIRVYHYPAVPVVCLAGIVLAVQILITYFVNMNFKKLSLIERIRFSE